MRHAKLARGSGRASTVVHDASRLDPATQAEHAAETARRSAGAIVLPPGEYDALSDQQKADIDADAMRDQALAVLSYIRLGKLDDARRLGRCRRPALSLGRARGLGGDRVYGQSGQTGWRL